MNQNEFLNKYIGNTDLAIDIKINNKENIKKKVKKIDNIKITSIEINNNYLKKIKKDGTYITIEFNEIEYMEKTKLINILKNEIKKFTKNYKKFLIIGLGNKRLTPDALGYRTINKLLITKHINDIHKLDKNFSVVSAFCPDVITKTGIENKQLIQSLVKITKPDMVIIIDSLMSTSIDRLNKTIQISDAGISPSSLLNKYELNKENLKRPVLSIGVPTVINANKFIKNKNLLISETNIDYILETLSDIIATSLNQTLHKL